LSVGCPRSSTWSCAISSRKEPSGETSKSQNRPIPLR
jgi:hypothetical protein